MPVNKSALLRYRIIDRCLNNPYRRFPTWQYLQEKIEAEIGDTVSKSTIDKDISAMKAIYQAPIQFNRQWGGYEYTQDQFSISSFPLTEEEIEALDFSTALLYQFRESRIFQQLENAINKIIDNYRIAKDCGIPEHKFLQVEQAARTIGTEWLEKALKAITQKEALHIRYHPFGRESSEHEVSPYMLKEYRNRWYLVGYALKHRSVRVFALDRIEELSEKKNGYVAPGSFDPEEFFRYSFGITQVHGQKPEKVVLSFTSYQAPYILTQPLHASQRLLSEEPNDVRVELTVYLTPELVMTILSYGKEVRVIAPSSLKQQVKETIQQIAAHYEREEVKEPA